MRAPDHLPIGTAMIFCPLPECPWTMLESLVADMEFHVGSETIAAAMTPGPHQKTARIYVDAAINQVSLERCMTMERDIRAHLESHDVLDFLRAIRSLEQQLAQRDPGIRPHGYRDRERDETARDEARAVGLTGSSPRDPSLDQDVDGYGERPR